jgi:virulence factor Mce-like protein
MSRRAGLLVGVLAALSVAPLAAGCGVSAADLPLPATGAGGPTYRLTAVFADALNLPDGAHVTLNGDEIGRVQEITTRDYTARVEMAVRTDITLPAGTTAELRQATPLGEVFVALHPPATAAPATARPAALRDGDTIGLVDTEASATVEDLLSSLSALVNGGGLAQVQTIVAELNTATDGRAPQIAHLLGQTGDTLATLNARTQDIDRVLAASERLSTTLRARRGSIDTAFDDLTPGISELAGQTDRLTTAVRAAGKLSDTGNQVIGRSGHDIRSVARDIGPVLQGFADTRPFLGTSLRDIVTFGKIFEKFTEGESAAAGAELTLLPLVALPGPGDRLPGPNDFVDGEQSFAEHLQRQFSTFGGTR